MEEKRYIAMDIGCLECGEPSALIGVYADKTTAEQALEAAAVQQAKEWHGQHDFALFETPAEQFGP